MLGGRVLSDRSSVVGARASLRIPAPAFPAPPLPAGADLRIAGLAPFITPNGAFYRVDTAIVLPQVAPESWMLRIHGMVRREIRISFGQLIRRPLTEDWITLCCVSNPVGGPYISNARWLGASLASLLRQAGQAVAEPAHGQAAQHGREQREHHQNAADQYELVVRAELTDCEILQRGRGEVDLQLTHGHHRGATSTGDARGQRGARLRGPSCEVFGAATGAHWCGPSASELARLQGPAKNRAQR